MLCDPSKFQSGMLQQHEASNLTAKCASLTLDQQPTVLPFVPLDSQVICQTTNKEHCARDVQTVLRAGWVRMGADDKSWESETARLGVRSCGARLCEFGEEAYARHS